MTGLDKIIAQIDADSAERCKQIAAAAEHEAETICTRAQQAAEALCAERNKALRKQLENMMQSAESSAELKKNQIVLKGKLAAIDETLEKALEVIKALPKKEYFEILKELILTHALQGKGVLHLSQADTEKLPQNFIDSVNSALKSKGAEILPGDSAEIDSGFVLVYGDIDINCTFPAIAASKREELRDALNGLLFS